MKRLSDRIFLIPLMTVGLLLLLDVFLISRMDEVPSIYQESHAISFPYFRTRDLKGNIVTHEIFAGKFSVVCLWVSKDAASGRELFCALSEWNSTLSTPVQLVGIIGDLRDTENQEGIAAIQSAIEDIPDDIPQLLVNDDLTYFLQRLRNAPTICFVDEHGMLVGQPVIGNEPALIQKEAERLIGTKDKQGELERKIQNSLFHRP